MSEIATIYLCCDGLLIPKLSDMVSDYVSAQGVQAAPSFKKSLIGMDRQLFVGQITFEGYIDQVNRILNQEMLPQNVLDWIAGKPYWNNKAAALIMELVGKKVYLICGIPRVLMDIWARQLQRLPIDEMIYTAALGLADYFESILDEVVRENPESLETVLWIDPASIPDFKNDPERWQRFDLCRSVSHQAGICDAKSAAGIAHPENMPRPCCCGL